MTDKQRKLRDAELQVTKALSVAAIRFSSPAF